MAELSYEFERYGEATASYFQGRAATLSVLVAFVMAGALNIDAIKLYGTLAKDKSLAGTVIKDLNIAKLEQAYVESIQKPGGGEEEKDKVEKEYKQILENIRKDAVRLEELGLPIGHDYFPFCASLTAKTEKENFKDQRCEVDTVLGRLATRDGIGWLFSVLLAGGLIGLGAPFWFKTYRFIASFVPGVKLPDSLLARQEKIDTMAARQGSGTPGLEKSGKPVNVNINTQNDSGLSDEDLVAAFKSSRMESIADTPAA